MIIQICYAGFDSRFCRPARDDGEIEPRWLFRDPPPDPPLSRAGGLGPVISRRPTEAYAACAVEDSIRLELTATEPLVDSQRPVIEARADERGHIRIRIEVMALPTSSGVEFDTILNEVASCPVTIRHPDWRGEYSTLAEVGDALADLYGRESARTALEPRAAYRLDWVKAGRPFIIVMTEPRDGIVITGATFDGPVEKKLFDGHVRFIPWVSEEFSMPVWALEVHRGGAAWREVAEALEWFTGHYEEYRAYLYLIEVGDLSIDETEDSKVWHRRFQDMRKGLLGRERRAGLALPPILKLLVHYDEARAERLSDVDAAINRRVTKKTSLLVQAGDQTPQIRIGTVTITTSGDSNIVNLGTMIADVIQTTKNAIDEADSPSDLKEALEQLQGPVSEAAGKLPPDEAKALMEDYEAFTKQALRPKPNPEQVKGQGKAIIDMVAKVAGAATPVVGLIAAVVKAIVGA